MSTVLPPQANQILRWSLAGSWRGAIVSDFSVSVSFSDVDAKARAAGTLSITVNDSKSLIPEDSRQTYGATVFVSEQGRPMPTFFHRLYGTYSGSFSLREYWRPGPGGGTAHGSREARGRGKIQRLDLSVDLTKPGDLGSYELTGSEFIIPGRSDANDEAEAYYRGRTTEDLPLVVGSHPLPASGLILSGSGNGSLPEDKLNDYSGTVHGSTGTGEIAAKLNTTWDLTSKLTGRILWFDGVDLMLLDVESRQIARKWQAFSGRPHSTASRSSSDASVGQRSKAQGPTPEGLYAIPPGKTLSREEADDAWDWIKWTYKSPSWGLYTTPLIPVGDTDTFGRSGMFVHGGAIPGSAGCIDLCDVNRDFHEFLQTGATAAEIDVLGIGLLMLVRYLPVRQELPRTHADPLKCPSDGQPCVGNPNCEINQAYERRVSAERSTVLNQIISEIQ